MKGKYAAKAQKRCEVAAADEQVAAAERALSDTQAELNAFRSKSASEIERLKERLADVTAERDSATAPRIAELEHQNAELNTLLRNAEAKVKAIQAKQNEVFHFVTKLLHNITGCTGLEASEGIIVAISGLSKYIAGATTGVNNPGRRSPDESKTLQRVNGWRSSPKVIEHLNSLIDAAKGK